MTSFNEFQRELQKRGIDRNNAYLFTLLYERMIQIGKDLDNQAKATLALANTLANFVQLNETMDMRLKELMKNSMPDGVEVKSVLPDPNDE